MTKPFVNFSTFMESIAYFARPKMTTMTASIHSFVLLLFLAAGQCAFGQKTFNYTDDFKQILEKTKDPEDTLSYDKLLNRFNTYDPALTDFEILALMIGFTGRPEYKPYDDLSTEREVYKLNGEKKYTEALDLGQTFLKTHPLSVKTLYEVAYSLHKLNKEDSVKYYTFRGQRIFRAMYFSGNGKAEDTPTFALGPTDGQDYINKFLGASIQSMGSCADKNGNFLDILETKFRDGQTLKMYFIIQHATNKIFEEKSIEK